MFIKRFHSERILTKMKWRQSTNDLRARNWLSSIGAAILYWLPVDLWIELEQNFFLGRRRGSKGKKKRFVELIDSICLDYWCGCAFLMLGWENKKWNWFECLRYWEENKLIDACTLVREEILVNCTITSYYCGERATEALLARGKVMSNRRVTFWCGRWLKRKNYCWSWSEKRRWLFLREWKKQRYGLV